MTTFIALLAGLSTLAVPAPTPTRDALKSMYQNRDTHCGTGDPWAGFAHRKKTPEELKLLMAWADDANEPGSSKVAALEALGSERSPEMTAFWRARLPRTAAGSEDRLLTCTSLLQSGRDAAVPEVVNLLGESEEQDLAIAITLGNEGLVPAAGEALAAFRKSGKASPPVEQEISRLLVRDDPSRAGDVVTEALTGPTPTASAVLHEAREVDPKQAELALKLLGRSDLDEYAVANVGRVVAFSMLSGLADEKRRKGFEALAEKWTRPDAATLKLLAGAPLIELAVATWLEGRGTPALALPVYVRATEATRELDSLRVAAALLQARHACLLNRLGKTTEAAARAKGLAARIGEQTNALDNLERQLRLPARYTLPGSKRSAEAHCDWRALEPQLRSKR